jgi:hypothetical protein
MKTILILLCLCAIVGGALFGGYKWGYRAGSQQATDQLATGMNITNCVYLTLADRKELNGDQVMARDLRNRLLFTSAMELDEAINSGRLDAQEGKDAQGVVKDVVEHYWRHPKECSLSSRDPHLDPLKPKFMAFLQEYKDAGTGQPATQSRQAKQ